jgi:hypothetical protein
MPNVSELTADAATTKFVYNGQKIEVTYKPSEFTLGMFEQIDSMDVTTLRQQMLALIVDWNLTQGPKGKTKKYEVNEQNMISLPLKFCRRLVEAVVDDTFRSDNERSEGTD